VGNPCEGSGKELSKNRNLKGKQRRGGVRRYVLSRNVVTTPLCDN